MYGALKPKKRHNKHLKNKTTKTKNKMSSTLKGTIKKIGEVQQVTEKFRKRDVVICDNSGKFAQYIPFQLAQDKCSLADNLNVGDEVDVSYNMNGKEYTDKKTGELKYFLTLEIWKVTKLSESTSQPQESGGASDDDKFPF